MKKNYFSRILLILFLLAATVFKAQDSFLIDFSAANPITVCNGSSALDVKLQATAASTTGATVTVQLGTGIEYVPGSVSTVVTNAGLSISESNITNLNAPVFTVNPGTIAIGNNITFRILRRGTCAARTADIGGGDFLDTVSAGIAGATTNTLASPEYQLFYPVLSMTQPAANTTAVLNTNYTRSFQINNGGTGCANQLYLEIDYPGNGIQNVSLAVTSQNGSVVTPIVLTPTVSGTTYRFIIPSTALPGGDLCNGENIVLTETYRVRICNAVTNYAAGWGCDSNRANWCQERTGTGTVAMIDGQPNFTALRFVRSNFVNSCSPFDYQAQLTNGATGNPNATGMYNVVARLGGGSNPTLNGWYFNYYQFSNPRVNGNAATLTTTGTGNNQIISVDLTNKFTSDPDGPGGLTDLDGDGFFDDLPGNSTLRIDFTVNVNCSLYSCPVGDHYEVYGIYADMHYNKMCDNGQMSSVKLTPTGGNNLGGTQMSSLNNKSWVPANVFNGTVFNGRFSVGYFTFSSALDTNKTRYVYEITLPAGISLSPTPNTKWYIGQFPDNFSAAPLTPTVTVAGNVVTVTSPDNRMGYVTLDLVNTCGTSGAKSIGFKLKRIDDASAATPCSCNPDVYCNSVVTTAYCDTGCTFGPTITSVKVERADNSLGYTDFTMTTLQNRSAISDFDLSKALYRDDINVAAGGRQNGASNNLYLKLILNKIVNGTDDKLTPKSINVTIFRGGSPIASGTVNTAAGTGSTTTSQTVTWNLTSLLPAGGLLNGDTFQTTAVYNVSSNNLPTHDEQTGVQIYFYNLDASSTEQRCNYLIPQFYLSTAAFQDRHNGGISLNASSCNSLNVGNGTNYLAYRFDPGGIIFSNEVRPGFLPVKYTFTVPTGYVMDRVTIVDLYPGHNETDVTAALTGSGNTYSFNFNPATLSPAPSSPYNLLSYPISVENQYSLVIRVFVKPSCATPPSGVNLDTSVEYIPQYYYFKKQATLPAPTVATKSLPITYNTLTKPSVTLTNITGPIQALKPSESITVRLSSTGTTTAPYTWIAIPTHSGVNIQQVVDLTTNVAQTPIPYSGGIWYKLSTAGLASGTSNNYRIDFTYTSCTATTFQVIGGWNCSSFPADPTAYTCGAASTNLTFTPQPGQIQINKITEPTGYVTMCDPIDFAYKVVSAGGGSTVANGFSIRLPAGLTVVSGSIQAEYPLNSGNWVTLTPTVIANRYILDLTAHPNYPVNGLPGTLSDGGNSNLRQIGIRFKAQTSCTFRSKSTLRVSTTANSTCGQPATGDGVVTVSAPIRIAGADSNYVVSTVVTSPSTVFENCANPVKLDITQSIVTSNPIGSTGEINIEIPVGYDYSSLTCTGTFCPTFDQVFTDATTGVVYARLKIPAGMTSGDQMVYSVNLIPNSVISCGSYSLDIISIDNINGIMCGTTACSSIQTETGNYTFNYTVNKPDYTINSVTGAFNGTNYAGTITVKNTSAMNATSPVKITFYCADDAGTSTGQVLGSHTLTSNLAAGATTTENFSFAGVNCSASGRVVAVISNTETCACTPTSNTPTVFCFKPIQNTGIVLDTNHGITALARAGADNSNWPMARKGAWTVLESKTKGFVVNRLTDAQLALIPDAELREGMMVFNITQDCLMINTDGTASGWKCFNNQGCPN